MDPTIPDDIFAAMAEGQRTGAIPKSPDVIQCFEWCDVRTGERKTWLCARMDAIAKGRKPTAEFPTADATVGKCGIDESYARATPDHRLKEPGIAVTFRTAAGKLVNVLADGNHRAYELHRRGVEKFPVRVLNEEESASCEVPPDAMAAVSERIK